MTTPPDTTEADPAPPEDAATPAEAPANGPSGGAPEPGAGPAPRAAAPQRQDDFTVSLAEVFQGPLDLLLHLVKEQEVEIQDVRLADVAHAYMDHVRALKDLDIEVAGEYLVIAATLMAIKSRSLLPREEVELEDDLDPQDELIQRLIEYRRFKGASDDLEDRFVRRSQEHPRGYRGEVRDNEPEKEFELGEVSAWDLLATFSRLMRETAAGRTHHVKGDPRPLRWYVQTIGRAVRNALNGASLRQIVADLGDVPTREGLVGGFCAILELMKIGLVTARQESRTDDIVLEWTQERSEEDDLDDLIRASRFMDEEDDELEESLGGGAAEGAGPESGPEGELEDGPDGDEFDDAPAGGGSEEASDDGWEVVSDLDGEDSPAPDDGDRAHRGPSD